MLGIDPDAATFARRGFAPTDEAAQARLESIGRTFILGYRAALEEPRAEPLAHRLDEVERERRGWAFEGAAMGLTMLDLLTPWNRSRMKEFLHGPARSHVYMAHIGIGWALARLRRGVDRLPRYVDPLLRWLVVDGYGFHQGYFHPKRYIFKHLSSKKMNGYAERAFDHGLGRSVWFVGGADVDRITAIIEEFSINRRRDLWAGVGLASAYAGGTGASALEKLHRNATKYMPHVRQGVAFAAKARELATNAAAHTDLAARILCGVSAVRASEICETTLSNLATESGDRSYESWRQKIRVALETQEVSV
ncbi:MAG: DUF1702 family protein [Planctomycetes bacterium]|nr:DUF1702 family protein [Planctomycetota bacterium]